MKIRRRNLIALALCAVPGVALAASSANIMQVGWSPIVALYGGDPQTAVSALSKANDAFSVYLGNTQIDNGTQAFLDDSTEHLKDFDLEGLHKLLPEEQGKDRALFVKGHLSGNKYVVTQAKPDTGFKVGLNGPRNELADMSASLRAREREHDGEDRFILSGRFGLGIGPLSWQGLMQAERDIARLATLGTPNPETVEPIEATQSALAEIRKNNPGLGPEDERVLGVLYDAFPALGKQLTQVGVVEDVQSGSPQDGAYPIRLRLKAEVDRMKKNYRHFASYVDGLDDVLLADLRLTDDQGRSITEIHVDSEAMRLEIRAWVKDGLPVPFRGKKVYTSEPLDPLSGALTKPTVWIDARLNMLGIIVELKDWRLDSRYQTTAGHTTIDGRLGKVPKIKVEGRAFGLFAPRFVDLFIPGDIEGQTRHFFEVITHGNGGKGGNAHIEIGASQPGGNGVIAAKGEIEAIDSFIVRVGAGVVADRVLPGKRAEEDAEKLAHDLHAAFKKDFARFARSYGG